MAAASLHRTLRAALLATSAGLLAVAACSPLEDALTDTPAPIATLRCEDGDVRAVAAITPPLVACPTRTWVVVDGAFAPFADLPITAILPATADRPWLVVGTADGRVGTLEAGKREVVWSTAPNLLEITPEPLYLWHPPGLAEVSNQAIVALYPARGRIVAVTAGAGAMDSGDGGRTWQYLSFTPRFMYIDAPAPVLVDDLVISPEGQIAFLFYPEGRQKALDSLQAQLDADAHDTEHGGGPHLARGRLDDQRMEVHYVRPGLAHHLVIAPDPMGVLWLFVQHPSRHEMTRFIGPAWGKSLLDSGYFDFVGLGATGSARRAAQVGLREDGRPILWLKGESELTRYALLDLPDLAPDKPVLIELEDHPDPRTLVLAQGPSATAFDLTPVGSDRRLLLYYVPLGLLALLLLAFTIRRMLEERRLRRHYEQKAEELRNRGVHWEQRVPDPPPPTDPAP